MKEVPAWRRDLIERMLDADALRALDTLCAQIGIPRECWPGVDAIRTSVETMAVRKTASVLRKDDPDLNAASAIGKACDQLCVDREAFRERLDRQIKGAHGWRRYDADGDLHDTDIPASPAP